ncbi:hypothetical protein Tco_1116690 [Tanacetum coccineum]
MSLEVLGSNLGEKINPLLATEVHLHRLRAIQKGSRPGISRLAMSSWKSAASASAASSGSVANGDVGAADCGHASSASSTGCGATGGSGEVSLPSLSIELDLPLKTSIVVLSRYLDSKSLWHSGMDNQEKNEKQSQNNKTGLGMEKTVKDMLSLGFRYDGNVIHIMGGDDKPVSVTGNEYDIASGGTTSNLSYGGNAVAVDRLIEIQQMCLCSR